MNVLSLDLSTKCIGWSIITQEQKLLAYGAIELSQYKKKQFPLQYILIAHDQLVSIMRTHQPAVCVIEATFNRNTATLRALSKMRGVAELACAEFGIKSVHELSTSHVRKVLVGDGSASKEDVFAFLAQRYGDSIFNDGLDISDSIAIALCWLEESK